jgi:hypothetical protein
VRKPFLEIVAALVVAGCSSVATTPPARSPTPTSVVPASHLIALTIAPRSHASSYARSADFGGFTDQHGCEDTRAVLLIRESRAPVSFTEPTDCTVKTGRWVDPWSGRTKTVAHDLDIDHTVPLDNAWQSGAWAWTHARRVAYANDLSDTDQLVPILLSENRSKGDDGPDAWKPPLKSSWCRYAIDWDRIKTHWHLTATAAEWAALEQMVQTC